MLPSLWRVLYHEVRRRDCRVLECGYLRNSLTHYVRQPLRICAIMRVCLEWVGKVKRNEKGIDDEVAYVRNNVYCEDA